MRSRIASLTLALGIAAAAAGTAHSTASAVTAVPPRPCVPSAPPGIIVQGGAYTPSTLTMSDPGGTVTWIFFNPPTTVTSTNLTLFNTAVRSSGTYKFTFWSAGTFPYADNSTAAVLIPGP